MWKSVKNSRCEFLGFIVLVCLIVGTTLLSAALTPSIAIAQDLRLDRQFPELAAALARRDPIAVRNQIDALDPQSKQRVLTALHANRWNPSGAAPGGVPGGLPGNPFGNPQGLGGSNGGAAGGASMANFTELMRLIETTITPDQWTNAGGTSTMNPFRQGVRIDPAGVIERLDPIKIEGGPKLRNVPAPKPDNSYSILSLSHLGDWQQPTKLRWISLHQLDRQLKEQMKNGLGAGIAAELLGGLCRIDYVAYDASSREWFLGGPAGNIVADAAGDLIHNELKLPPVLLEDLLSIAPRILRDRGEFGCSIDPDPDRLVSAYKLAGQPGSIRKLRRDPEGWAEEWKETLGRQHANIIGLPADSPTGYALLIADAHMKRLALGLEPSVDGVKNYWLETELRGRKSSGSMVRWWFSCLQSRIPYDPEKKIYHLESPNVQVLSETQMMDVKGERKVSERQDGAADAFARNFTARFDALQKAHPIYGRLRHIFDLAIALELIRNEIDNGSGDKFEVLGNPAYAPRLPIAPKEIDSIVATRKMGDGSILAIVSGGVSIDTRSIASRLREPATLGEKVSLEGSPGESSGSEDSLDKSFWR